MISISKYRRRFDILADIVRIASSGAKKTRIMYLANLSYMLLNKYLDDALHTGLLRFAAGEYSMTPKGEEFLQMYEHLSNRRSRLKSDFEQLKSDVATLELLCRRRRGKRANSRSVGFASLV